MMPYGAVEINFSLSEEGKEQYAEERFLRKVFFTCLTV
jgi:hypothetical protein